MSIGGIPLHLRGETRAVFMDWLRATRPDLVERYEELYARSAYGTREERARLQRLIGSDGDRAWRERVAAQRVTDVAPSAPPPSARQRALF